jgi:methylglyoxal synthase
MKRRQRIALVAHDNKRADLIDWVRFNRALLTEHDLIAIVSSPLMSAQYEPQLPDYDEYQTRLVRTAVA